jgi:hypothetical protein
MYVRYLEEMTVLIEFSFPFQSPATKNTEQRTRRTTQAKPNDNSNIIKPSLLFLHILLSPIFVAGFTIKILAPDLWKETTIVWGKNTSEGVPMEQSRAKNDGESGSICPNGSPCETKYAGITDITFSEPTVDPRPINITMGGELLQVSLKLDGVFTAEAIVLYHFATKHRRQWNMVVY